MKSLAHNIFFSYAFIKCKKRSRIKLEPVIYLSETACPDVEKLALIVKYWSLDVEVMVDGCVKSGPEILLKELGTFLRKIKAVNIL
jgi:hypothetical protein